MILKNGTFDAMARDIIRNDNRIIIFGCGVIGATVVPEIVKQYGLEERVECYIDNDSTWWGSFVSFCNRNVKIEQPGVLGRYPGKVTVLVTISRYKSAYDQLTGMNLSDDFSCFIIPAMCIDNFKSDGHKGVKHSTQRPVIPKRIHYMWLGGNQIPETLLKCMDSWREFCTDYEIIRWDESNYDVHKNDFVSQAYDNGKFGFVPDYARIELLYEYGGIYLDTDVELKRNIDDLLYREAFCGVEKWQVLNFGGCSGAVKGHKSLEPFLENWRKRKLIREDGTFDGISSGLIDTGVAISHGYVIDGRNQTVNGMDIFGYDYFHPYDYMSGRLDITDDTHSVHHFHGGWLDDKARENNIKSTAQYGELMQSAVMVY
ncbi:MAG: hypothetical protein MJ119_03935 [Lachnospiraceae bacterium]|nr:hypothetical protein [Lachnospiraceae bacterium]